MRVASSKHTEKTYYNDLNQICGGHLYQMLEEIPVEFGEYYDRYKQGQRARVAQAHIGEQCHWSPAPANRKAKEGSRLGPKILEYLAQVEQAEGIGTAGVMAETVRIRLGEIMLKLMEKRFVQVQADKTQQMATPGI